MSILKGFNRPSVCFSVIGRDLVISCCGHIVSGVWWRMSFPYSLFWSFIGGSRVLTKARREAEENTLA